jgi:hypothetical protein
LQRKPSNEWQYITEKTEGFTMKKTPPLSLIILLAVCTACSTVEPIAPTTTPATLPATDTQTPVLATATDPPIPTETATPQATSTPLPLLSLEYSGQQFTSPETVQAGLGDLDGDGDLDMVLANPMRNNSQVWLNNGDGEFTDSGQQLTQYGHGVVLADFDEDGDLDAFIVCHQFSLPSKVYLNDGTGTLTDSGQAFADASWSAVEVHTVDLNNDGHIDVHVSYYSQSGEPDRVYLNDGHATFSDSGLLLDEDTIAWGDLNGDGAVDYLGKIWGQGYVVRLNDGTGGFTTGWQMADPLVTLGGIGLADFDADGDLDALVLDGFRDSGSRPSRLFLNDGSGQFTDSGGLFNETMGADLALGDLDLDGDLDVIIANMDRPNEVWLYNGGSFIDSGLRLGQDSDMSSMPALGDLDGDGDLDIVFGRFRGGAEIWLNLTIDH